MSIDRENTAENVAYWRRVLNKPEPATAVSKPTQAERMAAWSARIDGVQATGTQTRVTPIYSTRSLHAPGKAFKIGEERSVSDGTRWRRTA